MQAIASGRKPVGGAVGFATSLPRPRNFTIGIFHNPSGEKVWRVNGWQGRKRIRENYRDEAIAKARRNELENQWLGGVGSAPVLRAVEFSAEYQKAATTCWAITQDPAELVAAVRHWCSAPRRASAVKTEVPKLDEAVRQFVAWADSPSCHLRRATRMDTKQSVLRLAAAVGNLPLADLTTDYLADVLEAGWPVPVTRDTMRRRFSVFLGWCMQRPRRWLVVNPSSSKVLEIRMPDRGVPTILTPRQILRVLALARQMDGGRWLAWVVRQLFGGLRPTEAVRMNWSSFNAGDAEIHLDAHHTKTARPRTIHLDPVAVAWIRAGGEGAINPNNSSRAWARFVKRCGFTAWPKDILRHTAISYKFRASGSYGLTAEWAGNSEAIIKQHYQGRVSSTEAAAFWSLHPDSRTRKQAGAKVISFRRAA